MNAYFYGRAFCPPVTVFAMIKILPILCLLLLVACSGEQTGSFPELAVPQPLLADKQAQQAGEQLFIRHCRECHGTAGEGRVPSAFDFQPPAPNFYDSRYVTLDPAYLFWRISKGKMVEPYLSRGSVMPAYGPHFTAQQIWQLVAYLQQRAAGNLQ
jgi:mono/diheme cytochrome c family protein